MTFEFEVKQSRDGKFEAWTPYRQVIWIRDTEREAVAALFDGMSELQRTGAIDLKNPHAPGRATRF